MKKIPFLLFCLSPIVCAAFSSSWDSEHFYEEMLASLPSETTIDTDFAKITSHEKKFLAINADWDTQYLFAKDEISFDDALDICRSDENISFFTFNISKNSGFFYSYKSNGGLFNAFMQPGKVYFFSGAPKWSLATHSNCITYTLERKSS